MIRVLIAAYSGLAADAYGAVLQSHCDVTVIGRACTPEEVEALLPLCNVLLLTPRLQQGHALELIRRTRMNHPAVKTIVTGVDEDAETLQQYVEAGADAYVLGREPVGDLMLKVRRHMGQDPIVRSD